MLLNLKCHGIISFMFVMVHMVFHLLFFILMNIACFFVNLFISTKVDTVLGVTFRIWLGLG